MRTCSVAGAGGSCNVSRRWRRARAVSGGIAGTHIKYLSATDGVDEAAADIGKRAGAHANAQFNIEHPRSDDEQMLREQHELDAVAGCC